MQVRPSSKGQIVLPVELRRKYRIKPGQPLELVDMGNHISLFPPLANPLAQARGMLKGETSLTRALLELRRQEKAREA